MMEPIIAKQQADSAPIPVIGIKPALESDSSDIEGEEKLNCIAISAYYKAEARGYKPGYEMQDCLDAEAEIIGN